MNAIDHCNLIDVSYEVQPHYIHGAYLNGHAYGLEGRRFGRQTVEDSVPERYTTLPGIPSGLARRFEEESR